MSLRAHRPPVCLCGVPARLVVPLTAHSLLACSLLPTRSLALLMSSLPASTYPSKLIHSLPARSLPARSLAPCRLTEPSHPHAPFVRLWHPYELTHFCQLIAPLPASNDINKLIAPLPASCRPCLPNSSAGSHPHCPSHAPIAASCRPCLPHSTPPSS